MVKLPAGTTIISGHASQSRNAAPAAVAGGDDDFILTTASALPTAAGQISRGNTRIDDIISIPCMHRGLFTTWNAARVACDSTDEPDFEGDGTAMARARRGTNMHGRFT